MADRTPDGSQTLARIASFLGLPVEHFTDPGEQGRWDGYAEGMQLLSRIESREGMRRALEALRAIADTEPGCDAGGNRS